MEWEQTPVKYTKMLKVVASGDGLLKWVTFASSHFSLFFNFYNHTLF